MLVNESKAPVALEVYSPKFGSFDDRLPHLGRNT